MEGLQLGKEPLIAIAVLKKAGISAWAVGGCVRDLLRGVRPRDWDIAAAASPEKIINALAGFRLIETGIRHGTVTAIIEGIPIEITACRREGVYSDNRHPDKVEFTGDLESDLARRDFTINALAYSPEDGLHDLFGGAEDIKKGVIRCIRRPEDRFGEDALRILRALRFAATLGYIIEEETAAAVHRLRERLQHISKERIASELCKLILGGNAPQVLVDYGDVIGVVLPEIAGLRGFRHREEHGGDLWHHSVAPLACAPQNLEIRWALLLRDCGKPLTKPQGDDYPGHGRVGAALARQALTRLRLPNAVVQRVETLVCYHSALPKPSKRALLYALHGLGRDVLFDLLAMREADRAAHGEDAAEIQSLRKTLQALLAGGACYQVAQLAVDGNEIAARGFSGRQIGEKLSALLFAVMSGECENTRAALIAYLERP